MIGIIYKATNIINNKFYIGKTTKDLNRRKYEHHTFGKKLTYFQKAIIKYGKENFKWEVLKECFTIEELNTSEIFFINESKAILNGYNLTNGGDGASFGDLNVSKRPEVKIKLRNNFKGKKHTEETKSKISNSLKGRKLSDEQKLSISIGQKGILLGRFIGDKSKLAKKFLIIHPNDIEEEIIGLKKFCRDNKLDPKSMRRVARGEQQHHKGFKCKYL